MSVDRPPYKKPKLSESDSCLTKKEARKSLSEMYHELEKDTIVTKIKNECAGDGNRTVYFFFKGSNGRDPKEGTFSVRF